jgi:hypothetical protein
VILNVTQHSLRHSLTDRTISQLKILLISNRKVFVLAISNPSSSLGIFLGGSPFALEALFHLHSITFVVEFQIVL